MFLCSDGLPQKIWKNKSVGPLQVKSRTTATKTTATTINCLRHELWFRKLEGQYFEGIALRNRKYYLTTSLLTYVVVICFRFVASLKSSE